MAGHHDRATAAEFPHGFVDGLEVINHVEMVPGRVHRPTETQQVRHDPPAVFGQPVEASTETVRSRTHTVEHEKRRITGTPDPRRQPSVGSQRQGRRSPRRDVWCPRTCPPPCGGAQPERCNGADQRPANTPATGPTAPAKRVRPYD